MKKNLYTAGIILCVCIMLSSAFMICRYYSEGRLHTDEFENLVKIVENQTGEGESIADDGGEPSPNYMALHLQNSDMVGWIKIEGTSVNYPVMQTRGEPDYYLKHNFDRQYSDYGVPYADASCDVFLPSDNVIIHGHHIKNGKMFGALRDYKDEGFWEEHRIIRFDTLAERNEYEILAVFETITDADSGFEYYKFVNAENKDEFNAFVSKCKELSLYETDITAEYGDKLLTLSTCEYFDTNARFAVVAKKITE